MSRQVATRACTAQSVIRSAQFVRAFNEARAGKPFDYAYLDTLTGRDVWAYERGRIFGIAYPDTKLKEGNRVTPGAIMMLGVAIRTGIIL